MTQKTNRPNIVIDTNKHGIRRETNLDKIREDKIKKQERRNKKYIKTI